MNTPEFIQKIGRVALQKPSCSDVYTVEMAEFVETFFRIAVPSYFKYGFFIEGGALAVENALKVAFDWKVRKNFAKGATAERGHKVLHFRHAFHGRSGYTLTITNTDPTKTDLFPKFEGWPRVDAPAMRFPLTGENYDATVRAEESSLQQIRHAFETEGEDIACAILEPIQGEGGDNHFRPEFLQALRELCDKHEVMLIFDEVQTGVGLTGTMWAHQGLGVRPDIMAFGKKSQVCGILVTERVDEVPENVFHKSSRINSTWGGNLVDMVRFTRYLQIIEEDRLVENARTVGSYLQERLAELAHDMPAMVSNVRGRGLMCAIDLPTGAIRDEVRNRCYENGLMILGCGERSIRVRPALNLTTAQADEGIEILRRVISSF
jgi:L-lysine 6-transaminase